MGKLYILNMQNIGNETGETFDIRFKNNSLQTKA